MSSFELAARPISNTPSLFGGFARLVSVLRVVLDVWSEAQRQVYEIERRYPFTVW